jgi:primosomal protein N' (replication factor Y)
MVTKGLNFPDVTLVGVINPDSALYAGSYKSQERTFALVTQVIGRAGRGEKPGRAVIQTFTPQNEVIRFAANQDYDAFYEREIRMRHVANSPPFVEMHCAYVTGMDEQLVVICAHEIRKSLVLAVGASARVLGPSPSPVVRVSNRYRYRVFAVPEVADSRFRLMFAELIRTAASDVRFKKLTIAGINGAFDS